MASDILQAKIAGVRATKTSGAPGDQQKIRIRGQTSFFASAEPLYVIDGVPVPIVNLSSLGIAHLNVHDIENVTVLRDASSASLYGYQGGNGVVLIDTKKGVGDNKITLLNRVGIQQIPHYYDLHTSSEYIATMDSAKSKINSSVGGYPSFSDKLCNRDWQKEVFTTGVVQEYQVAGEGSMGEANYYLSGNYTDHKGIVKTSRYTRYTGFARVRRNFGDKLAVNLGYRATKEENRNNVNEYRGNDLIVDGVTESPCIECTPYGVLRDTINPPPHHYNTRTFFDYKLLYADDAQKYQPPKTPKDYWNENHHSIDINSRSIDLSARYQINNNLSINLMESAFTRKSVYDANFQYEEFNVNPSRYSIDRNRVKLASRENVFLANHQLSISYNKQVGQHLFNFVGAHRYYVDNLWWNVDSIEGHFPDQYSLKNSMAAYGNTGAVARKLTSYVGHMSYDYKNRYFLSAVGHLGRLKEGLYTDYYSFFPSLAISWDISNESIFDNVDGFDEFKLYYNIGKAGNYPLNGLANDLYREISWGEQKGMVVQQISNHSLRHEQVVESDYGMKSSFFNDRLMMSGAYFIKNIENMLLRRDIPYYYGGGKAFVNLGKVDVTGYEVGIEFVPVKNQHWAWVLSGNYFTSNQIVKELGDNPEMLFHDDDILMPDFRIKEGENIGNIYGYKFLGKATPGEKAMGGDSLINIFMGDKYANNDSTASLNEGDKMKIGNSIPKHNLNFNTSVRYKSWMLDMTWYAVWGYQKFNATRGAAVMTGLHKDATGFITDSVMSMKRMEFYESDLFMEDAGFLRLKRLGVSYMPEKKVSKIIVPKITLSFENLITMTKYSGYDPESTIYTDNNFSDNGIDRGAYPSPKSVFLTIQVTF